MKLEIDSAYFKAGNKLILSDAYLSIESHEIIGLLGRNGAGKSTLLKLIFGFPNTGSANLRVDGKQYSTLYSQGLIQYQSHQPFLPGSLTISKAVAQFIADPSLVNKITNCVEELPDRKLKSLSLGKRKLVESLILLNTDVPFLLMDEPFSGLSPLMVEQLEEDIKEASARKGILITDHWYEPVIRMSHQLTLMNEGSLMHIQDLEELKRLGYLPG